MVSRFVKGAKLDMHDPVINKDVSFIVVLQNNKLLQEKVKDSLETDM